MNPTTEVQILRDENSFIKERVRFLEEQLRDREEQSHRSIDRNLIRLEGERIRKNIFEIEQSNFEIYSRLNALTRSAELERDDNLELSILHKINEEVSELIESNKLLVIQVRAL